MTSPRRRLRLALVYAGLAFFLVIALFPVVWMAITAFKEEGDLYRMDAVPFWFHQPPTLKNFELLFFHSNYFVPSLINDTTGERDYRAYVSRAMAEHVAVTIRSDVVSWTTVVARARS